MTSKAKETAVTEGDDQQLDQAAVNLSSKTVFLDEPIKRGKQEITSVDIRKPNAGELRGVSLVAITELDVTALQRVLPRVTTPTLTQHDVAQMEPADLLQCGTVLASFLLKKAQRQEAFQAA